MNARLLAPCALVLVSALLGACANPPGAAAGAPLPRVAQTQTLKLGYREDAQPFSFKGADGKPTGYSVALCQRVAASIQAQLKLPKLDVQWVPVTAATRMQAVNDGTVDIECGSTTRTLGREQQVDFSNTIWVEGASFVTQASSPMARPADLNGKRVGVIPGTTTEAVLKRLSARGIAPVLVPMQTHTEGIAAVRTARIDAYATDRLILLGEALGQPSTVALKLSDDYLSIEPYALMMRRDADLRLAVNRGLAEIYRSGAITEVFRQSFPAGARPSPLLEAVYILNALEE
ncbi:amino acid ABC transporter substrate-binding protein [Variovorax ginsengisoli]|uniref:Amino acid ABC transporter substrate-binding protein n=1 Tax=Variovorax ginsengisoli TaxID=363844 RepID=A0ABT8S5N3_9BURK|nr:amino acid ABC transporter substrate-binding protein [Variovorax ginsengisoli]MDN8615053.1 amino acid ABC transporter substrate-binding protein [Variovorax ginsengisoli]MDO1534223.1 amino acid ABC transporter substrate-binding protein [Variovorax ginsengisoli]